tara:strand:- start:14564 stop:15361 length:798 start_codon:yes stop_codon:yes gene_type:complete
MRTILFTKKSSAQIYCANYLFEKGILTDVVFEKGSSFRDSNIGFLKKISIYKNISWSFSFLFYKLLKLLNNNKYYGNEDYYNKKILVNNYEKLKDGLKLHEFNSVNDKGVLLLINKISPKFVFVFGTGMIKKQVINNINCPKINLHFGLSPFFRGEGIVSALATEGPKSVGITIHYLDEKIDSGEIILQEVPEINNHDNFYSIGLKLTLLGASGFHKVFNSFKKNNIVSVKQDLSLGKLFDNKFMKNNQHFYFKAWKTLKKIKND